MSRKTVFCLVFRQSGFQTPPPAGSGNMRLSRDFPTLVHGFCLVPLAAAANLTVFLRKTEPVAPNPKGAGNHWQE
jgi:hypothetical protein